MGIAFGLVLATIGGTILGLGVYFWERYQEGQTAKSVAAIEASKES